MIFFVILMIFFLLFRSNDGGATLKSELFNERMNDPNERIKKLMIKLMYELRNRQGLVK